ncbi:MAG: hypothetical protein M9898_02180 [Chitinophagaceae bacterium]|nr:hypothetical protein [Chitinophagaceae bacterium]
MKTFTYKGKDNSAAGDIALIPGVAYTLDEKDPHVKSLIAQGFLEETVPSVQEPEEETESKPTKKIKK